MSAAEVWQLVAGHPGYPPSLGELEEPPTSLWGLGDRELVAALEPGHAVTIVGARRVGAHGADVARRIACELAEAGMVIVSGMAFGCDSAAHEGALEAGGMTIAVLGGGPDVPYPQSKRGLHRRILEGGGAVIAEHPPGTEPTRWSFPRRNRIMAALSAMTLVVEARAASGTRITADEAIKLGREVGAVPGSVSSSLSELPNQLIREGALLVRDGQDVLDSLLGPGAASVRRTGPALEPQLREALDAIDAGAETADAVAVATRIEAAAAAVALARLELLGYIRVDGMGRISPTGLAPPSADRERS